MKKPRNSGRHSRGTPTRNTGRRQSCSFEDLYVNATNQSRSSDAEEDAEELQCTVLEKCPTFERSKMALIAPYVVDDIENQQAGNDDKNMVHKQLQENVRDTGTNDQQWITKDNGRVLRKLRDRLDRIGITFPTIEVRFENLTAETDCYDGNRALPTLVNAIHNIADTAFGFLGIQLSEKRKLTILDNVSGVVKPSRMTLLLGPPSSGKTTLLLALAGQLDPGLKVDGTVTYNGRRLNEFVPQRTSAYINQIDIHVGEMTVKETLDFSARCQGIGSRFEFLSELDRKEKQAGIFLDAEVDFIKARATKGVERNPITDYTLKILGLDMCREAIVGSQITKGISEGQKRQLTTGEMIVGQTKALFMDEISSGLDTSTTFQIVKYLQQMAHLTEATILISLLHCSSEIFNLFDDVILLAQSQIIYQGPREHIVEFFESIGFRCPERKGITDFLQEVTSRRDQEQYWVDRSKPYTYISVSQFAERFKQFHVGERLENELLVPYDKAKSHKAALVFKKYLVPKKELFKASFDKEWLLIKRTGIVYIAKILQISFVAILGATMFLRTRMHSRNEEDGALYVNALLYGLISNMFNCLAELPLTVERLPVLYKHRNQLFHPTWMYTVPTILLRVPISVVESIVWTIMTYYIIGFAPEASRFFKQILLTFLIQQMASGIYRLIAAVCRTMMIANSCGTLFLQATFLFGGFILHEGQMPDWWQWAYWASPLSYGFNALTTNEMFAPRWIDKLGSDNATRLGEAVLRNFGVTPNRNWFWIGAAALTGFAVLFNTLFTLALTYLDPPGKRQAIISTETTKEMESNHEETEEKPRPKTMRSRQGEIVIRMDGRTQKHEPHITEASSLEVQAANAVAPKRGMVLPFTPLSMSIDCINYYVDMPLAMKEQGVTEKKLQLLKEVSGAFRPGVLTALMGINGSGKTTLMDVLAGRKTGGNIEGDIRISGFPKNQETFTRISGYCEQNDIHSPQVTIYESLIFSAFLRLPKDITNEEKMLFVHEVMDLVELENLKDTIVGIPGVTGLSKQQRKRLTIAVELVANPSIIFMDEPTTGLDASEAAIVMRAVRNTVDTGRTVVCAIHQPSIDIFEAFDELLMVKRGEVIYWGPLGQNSEKVIEYFEGIPGVPKVVNKQNPATWLLEVTSVAAELQLGINFAEHYKSSTLYQRNSDLVNELSIPPSEAKELHFTTQYSQTMRGQFKYCVQRQWQSYWRTPEYNLVRFCFTMAIALLIGTMFWKVGTKRDSRADLAMVFGGLNGAVFFAGIINCNAIVPIAAFEKKVFYRERAAGMYSGLPYSMAQVIVEIPYVFVQTICYTLIVYAMVSFQWTAAKYFWCFFIHFFTFLYFTYQGLMAVSVTPNEQLASSLTAAIYSLFNIFSGFFIPRPKIPKWWIWCYWICPLAWTFHGLIASQYGDIEDTIKVPGMSQDPTMKWYVKNHFGYETDYLGPLAVVLVSFTVAYALMYSYCLNKLNFQTR